MTPETAFSLFTYTSHLVVTILLCLCFFRTEEHFCFLVVASLRIGLFTVMEVGKTLTEPYLSMLEVIEQFVVLFIATSIFWYAFTAWNVKYRVRIRTWGMIVHGIVCLGALFCPIAFQPVVQTLCAVSSIGCGLIIIFAPYRNVYLAEMMNRLFRQLTVGILCIYPFVLLFDPFFLPVQWLRPLYRLELPLYYLLDIWVNGMVSYIALKTMYDMPYPGDAPLAALPFSTVTMTPREQDVLQLLLAGRSNGEVAQELSIAVPTVKTHVRNIYQKSGVTTRYELMCKAMQG